MIDERKALHQTASLGDRAADAVARNLGSWRFVLGQTAVVIVWMLWNGFVALRYLKTGAFDPFPFILLNLAFSTQAAYAAPILQMASNRSASRDRARDDLEAQEVAMLCDLVKTVLEINRQQTVVIEEMHQHVLETRRLLPLEEAGPPAA